MTDNEIIKEATEAYNQNLGAGCYVGALLNIINRQKAENEELQDLMVKYNGELAKQETEIERLQKAIAVIDVMEDQHRYGLRKAKAEAIKEFAERLKDKSCKLNMCHNNIVIKTDYQISGDTLDNLVKEMVGADNGGE